MVKRKRWDIKGILKDPKKRKEMIIQSIMAIQYREGIMITYEQAEAAYEKIQKENEYGC
jgi:hypothetical protein